MKYFRMSYEEVVFKRSYLNLILLNCAIPGFKPFGEDDEDDGQEFDIEEKLERIKNKSGKKTKNSESMHAGNFFMNFM